MMKFELLGPIVPYVRRTTKGKYSPRAQRYHHNQNALGWQIKQQMLLNNWQMYPPKLPLTVNLTFFRQLTHNCDLDNLVKAVLDAAQEIVYPNDRWIDGIQAYRGAGEDVCVFYITSFDEIFEEAICVLSPGSP